MLNSVFHKYFNNFGKLAPYFLVQVIFNVVLAKLLFIHIPARNLMNFNIGSSGLNIPVNEATVGTIGAAAVVFILLSTVIGPLFAVYIRLVIRNVLDDKEIVHMEIIRKTFSYYWRYVGLVLLMVLIVIGLALGCMVLSVIPVLRVLAIIAVVIFAIYLFTILTPCTEYMIYGDLSVEEGFSSGKEVGKQNFWNIFFFILVTGIISGLFKTDGTRTLLLAALFVFITQAIEAFKIMYIMGLCKQHKDHKYGIYSDEV